MGLHVTKYKINFDFTSKEMPHWIHKLLNSWLHLTYEFAKYVDYSLFTFHLFFFLFSFFILFLVFYFFLSSFSCLVVFCWFGIPPVWRVKSILLIFLSFYLSFFFTFIFLSFYLSFFFTFIFLSLVISLFLPSTLFIRFILFLYIFYVNVFTIAFSYSKVNWLQNMFSLPLN